MGRLKELYDKQAKGELTDAEEKELKTLVSKADADADEDVATGTTEPTDEDVDKAAQKLADTVQKSLDDNNDRFEKILLSLKEQPKANVSTNDKNATKIFVDKKLGERTVGELGEMKVALPGRETKKVKEISMKSVQFVAALMNNNVEKLQILSEGTAADGGYLVPEEFANMIVEDIRDQNVMRRIAAPPITITSDTLHLPNLASRPQANWRAEKAVKATSTANFGENVLTPYSLAVIVGLSNELVADASLGVGGSIVNYVSGLMATSLAEKEEQAFWVGNGSGKPTGVDGGGYTLRTFAAGAGATDVLRADKLIEAYHNTPQGYRNRAVFVANMGTWGEIGRLKDSQNRYLLTDLAGGPTMTIKGRPVYESNYLAGGTVLFGDFSFYQIVDREGINVRVSDEAYVAGSSAFEKNLTFVRVEKRVDAELTLPAAISKVTGLGTP